MGMFGKKLPVNGKKKHKEQHKLPKNESEKDFVIRIQTDFAKAKTAKEPHKQKCQVLNEYYHNKHYTDDVLSAYAQKYGVDFVPPVVPEPYVQVESQVDTVMPTFQFRGVDEELDPEKAKQRENVVKHVFHINKMDTKILNNERELNKYGDAFWVAGWDNLKRCGRYRGEIFINVAPIGQIFPDPSAKELQDGEYAIRAYRMHVRAGRRKYGKKFNEVIPDSEHHVTDIFNNAYINGISGTTTVTTQMSRLDDDTVMIVEYYYRDDDGDIGLAVIANDVLLKHVEKFWGRTRYSGNQMFPIVQWNKTPVLESIWSIGEIEMILDLVDSANRELATALLNDAFMANDIVVAPENAQPDGVEWVNEPGAIWWTSQGASSLVQRLGGVSQNGGLINMMEMLVDKIQQTNGNSDSAMGVEPNRVTTASGIAQLNERADKRKEKKNAGRLVGLAELVRLVDWLALEFYDEERTIAVQKDGTQEIVYETFKSGDMAKPLLSEVDKYPDLRKDEIIERENELSNEDQPEYYFPQIDVRVDVGQGFRHSKAFTYQATVELMQYPITPFNVEVAKALVDLLDLPNADVIKDSFDKMVEFELQRMQAEMQAQQAQMQAQQAQQQFANQGAVETAQEVQGGITEDEALTLIEEIVPEQFQEMILSLESDEILMAVEEMSQMTPDEVADFLVTLSRELQ